jgi:hypothetical protein
MHRHEMQQSNIYLGIYHIEYYFLLEKSGCYRQQVGAEARVVTSAPIDCSTVMMALPGAWNITLRVTT